LDELIHINYFSSKWQVVPFYKTEVIDKKRGEMIKQMVCKITLEICLVEIVGPGMHYPKLLLENIFLC
jgi:hypothetical protein